MKKIAIAMLACFVLLKVSAADLNWLTDLPQAQAQAKTGSKLVLLDFTGSDWCGWCMKLDA
jgi:protein disulfide-isomerase